MFLGTPSPLSRNLLNEILKGLEQVAVQYDTWQKDGEMLKGGQKDTGDA